jgi:hypothetical protein
VAVWGRSGFKIGGFTAGAGSSFVRAAFFLAASFCFQDLPPLDFGREGSWDGRKDKKLDLVMSQKLRLFWLTCDSLVFGGELGCSSVLVRTSWKRVREAPVSARAVRGLEAVLLSVAVRGRDAVTDVRERLSTR